MNSEVMDLLKLIDDSEWSESQLAQFPNTSSLWNSNLKKKNKKKERRIMIISRVCFLCKRVNLKFYAKISFIL
jgi:hypothetical protein